MAWIHARHRSTAQMPDPDPFPPTTATLMPLPQANDALPVGRVIGDFEIREVIGVGGFGIVYRAWEAALERDVAIKEYMPMGMVGRDAGGSLTLRSKSNQADFDLGLASFLNEAKLLARFDHSSLVKVHRFWEEGGTAYMAMPFYRGQTLRQRRQESGATAVTEAWLMAMLEPLLGALAEMHRVEVFHRDIAPDNILWCADGRPVLLDFGAARRVLADRTQHLTAVLKPQFAPIEQYSDAHAMRQGPWTDIFALASTCYFMLAGRPPLPATARILSDDLTPLSEIAPPGFSRHVLDALDWSMAVHPADRPQSVAAFRDALHGHEKVPARPAPARAPAMPLSDQASGYERTMQATTPFRTESITASVRLRESLDFATGNWHDLRPRKASPDAAPGAARTVSYRWPLLLAAVTGAALVMSHRDPPASPASDGSAAAVANAPETPSAAGGGTATQASDDMRHAAIAAVAASASPSASAAMLPSKGKAASAPVSPSGPREACIAGQATNVEACVKRLCKTEPRFKRSSTCVKLERQRQPWWKIFRKD